MFIPQEKLPPWQRWKKEAGKPKYDRAGSFKCWEVKMISKNIPRRIFEETGDAVGGVIFGTPSLYLYIFEEACRAALATVGKQNKSKTTQQQLES